MTAEASHAILADSRLFADIVDILSNVTGVAWLAEPAGIAPDARLETDLRMESIELVAFGDELRRHYGDQVDLPRYLATLELDQLVGLTVADVAGYVAGLSSPSRLASLDQQSANLDIGTPR